LPIYHPAILRSCRGGILFIILDIHERENEKTIYSLSGVNYFYISGLSAKACDRRNRHCAEKLVSLGYTNIWNLKDGMVGWEQAGFDIKK